jgi:hypothetical protein
VLEQDLIPATGQSPGLFDSASSTCGGVREIPTSGRKKCWVTAGARFSRCARTDYISLDCIDGLTICEITDPIDIANPIGSIAAMGNWKKVSEKISVLTCPSQFLNLKGNWASNPITNTRKNLGGTFNEFEMQGAVIGLDQWRCF